MTHTAQNLARLKNLYVSWDACKGDCLHLFEELLADRVSLGSMDQSQPGLAFAAERVGVPRAEALRYFAGIFDQWEMVFYHPDHFVAEGDRIAMFGVCAYRNRATQKVAECRIACLWRFEGDKAVEFIDVFDSARAVAAATA